MVLVTPRTTRTLTALTALSLALVTSACGSIAPGATAAEEFTQHFSSGYPDHVLEAVTTATDELPWVGGAMGGSLILADDTPPDTLAAILEDVTTWEPDADADYDGVGVLANGLCLCGSDIQQDQKQQLRDRLYAEGLALQGTWRCPNWLHSHEPPYRGELSELMQDTATVRSLWEKEDGELRVVADVSTPAGSVDHAWATLPESLPDVLAAVGEEQVVTTFDLTDGALRIAVPPTTRLAEAQAVAEAAAGPDLTVQVMQGSLDPQLSERLASLAPLGEALQPVPGVETVLVEQDRITLSTRDVGAVRGIHDAALEHPEFQDGLALRIRYDRIVPDADHQSFFYEHPSGSTGERLPVFEELAALRTVTRLWVTESRPEVNLDVQVNFTRPLADALPQVKGIVPDGIRMKATGPDHRETVSFTTARTLARDDLRSSYESPDLGAIASAWNDAG